MRFSVVIPTMWKSENIINLLNSYYSCNFIDEIILIDNDPENKLANFKTCNKLIYYTENKNLFVNPSWNKGFELKKKENHLILSNDDIIITDITQLFSTLMNNLKEFDIIGRDLNNETLNGNGRITIEKYNGKARNNWGSFLYVRNYRDIPKELKIWGGDDLLLQHNKRAGILKNSGITGDRSVTACRFKSMKHKEIKILKKIKNAGNY